MGKAVEPENGSELIAIYEISKILNSSLDLNKTLRETGCARSAQYSRE